MSSLAGTAGQVTETKAQYVLSLLPFTFFFPQAIGYVGFLIFMVAWLAEGQYSDKWQAMRRHPLFWPTVGLTLTTLVASIFLTRPQGFWGALAHYQIYWILLVFVSVKPGPWQRRAVRVFFAGALMAATVFYLLHFQWLPNWKVFQSYIAYAGNKSILLGILLAIAAGWMLYELMEQPRHKLLRLLGFAYVAAALLLFAKTRTGHLIFAFICLYVVARQASFSWRSFLAGAAIMTVLIMAWQTSDGLRTRFLGTVDDVRGFVQGETISSQGIRLEIYQVTLEVIKQRPVTGNGIGTWLSNYQEKAEGLASADMTTPHNDYLLYAAEIGLVGLAMLLWLWIAQLAAAVRLRGEAGFLLFTLTVAMMIGGMFNAIIRDTVFGLAFMVLLAIPLAGRWSSQSAETV